ncbi:MAG: hypothetical protein ABI884_13815 [Gemmatimonadota bacterium]
MKKKLERDANEWTSAWLESVKSGPNAMSQRRLSSVERLGGGLRVLRSLARAKGIHLVLLIDDKGVALLAASKHPFKIIA